MFRARFVSVCLPLLLMFLLVGPASAQENTGEASPSGQAPVFNWATNCASPSRLSPLECSMEQRVVIRETGQQLARLVIRIGSEEPRSVALLIQLPLGLSIRSGVKLLIDGKEVSQLDIQTCDTAGCYAGSAVSAELLSAFQSGKAMNIEFQDLQQKPINVNFVLDGFTANFRNVQ